MLGKYINMLMDEWYFKDNEFAGEVAAWLIDLEEENLINRVGPGETEDEDYTTETYYDNE